MAMAQLPQDLIEEILSWLPVKSLMRFRCVSRTWNSLIFQAHFVKLNLQRSSRNTHVLLRCQINTVFEDMRDLPGIAPCSICSLLENPSSTVDNGCHQLDNRYLFIGSYNGLVWLINLVARGEFSEYRVWFCNLATRIMSEDSPHLCLRSCNYKLWWYQVKCGFGYDDRSDTYKVVLVLSNIKSQNWELRVHRLGDTHWRKVLTCPAFPILGEKCGQPVSGTVNWFAIRKLGFDYEWETVTVDQLVIFSYDLNKETFKYLLMPNGLSQVPRGPELGVLKGCLCLSHVHQRTHFVVWLMREFGVENSWTQLLNVTLELLQAPLPCVILKPLCISENGDVLLLANYISSKFILYNKKDNRIVYTQDFNNQVPMSSHDYIQSLVLPYGN
ncbi:hypothetical protein GLYMA_19G048000v4 [Glycine max]|uniref:F-box domain-containing protein n=1 Tax=Glycine max TaxID=3847 RepID=A0A0R0EI28_SOYBN|nr:F-box/kelch-repeat protein At3g23880 [Glycine max]KAG4926745.1 hypothetical protein JHK85_053231 [Glycine max]KAH1193012.1 F-box/kelch-repeat protein [Glycine max]KRG93903.1 hypothetical protein GLYMA_19G048000v4 [Glycine max]|eukprot:XP_006605026.2 F-box/kelch-repeat protein At3g23880 [Glycine max]